MKVIVLVDGTYNNPRHRAGRAKAGDIIEVAGGGYGSSLVRDGFVTLADVPAAEPADAPAAEPVDAPVEVSPPAGKRKAAGTKAK